MFSVVEIGQTGMNSLAHPDFLTEIIINLIREKRVSKGRGFGSCLVRRGGATAGSHCQNTECGSLKVQGGVGLGPAVA